MERWEGNKYYEEGEEEDGRGKGVDERNSAKFLQLGKFIQHFRSVVSTGKFQPIFQSHHAIWYRYPRGGGRMQIARLNPVTLEIVYRVTGYREALLR